MNIRSLHAPLLVSLALCGLFAVTSCKRRDEAEPAALKIHVDPKLGRNRVGELPGAVYQAQAASPFHWQPWAAESFRMAKDAHRLVFCVVAMPQYPEFSGQLDALAADPRVRDAMFQNYVPVLVDGDAAREMGLFAAELSAEINNAVRFPFFIWLTHEGNAVSWTPLKSSAPGAVVEMFLKADEMVAGMWREDPEYVIKNSAADAALRRDRMLARKNRKVMSGQPEVDVVRGIRQLASLYDSTSRSFDESGGLFPSGAINLLASAAIHPGLPLADRKRCERTVREFLSDLLRSPMFDPLDGGLFNARRGPSWQLPTFSRDCPSQGRAAVALIQAWRATGEPLALQRAEEMIRFAENSYRTEDGLFAIGAGGAVNIADWLWNVEDVRNALPPEDAEWWIRMSAMDGRGNLPSESDPDRAYFRANSLSQSIPAAEIAAGLGISEDDFAARHDRARKTLLQAREKRMGKSAPDRDAHLGASLRMVSAYAFAFGATGREAYRKTAVELLERCREKFHQAPLFRVFSSEAPPSVAAGRAFHYALALQAAIDVAAITSDDRWLVWAEDLATTAAEKFTGSEFLKECPDDARIIEQPVTDLMMVFDDSTAGLVSMAECRLAALNRPLVASFSNLATPLPTFAVDRPILHTDLLEATLARAQPVTLLTGADLPADLRLAVERIQPRMIHRRAATAAESVPAGAVQILYPDGTRRLVHEADELSAAVMPPTQDP